MSISFPRWAVVLAILAALPWSGFGRQEILSRKVITVCPSGCAYAEVQQAIDGASPGEIIQVEPGTYEGNLVITKSLTLKGVSRDHVVIKGAERGKPVILIEDDPARAEGGPITVRIEGLTITEGQAYCRYWPVCADGILARGTVQATITNNVISNNGWGGIAVWGEARVAIEGNRFFSNRRSHIGLWGSAQATIRDNQILDNGDDGIVLQELAQATIQGNRISGNICGVKLRNFAQATIDGNVITEGSWGGLELRDEAQAIVTDNQISDNEKNGLQLRDSSRASIVRNRISDNGGDGIVLWRSAQATLANNTISQNRNGVLLGRALEEGTPQAVGPLKLWGNEIYGNKGWGIVLYLAACGFAGAPEALDLPIQGDKNEIYDNGRGDLCPEDYPWPEGFTEVGDAG